MVLRTMKQRRLEEARKTTQVLEAASAAFFMPEIRYEIYPEIIGERLYNQTEYKS